MLDSQVSAVQEILPDLGAGFITVCLHNMAYNVEVCYTGGS